MESPADTPLPSFGRTGLRGSELQYLKEGVPWKVLLGKCWVQLQECIEQSLCNVEASNSQRTSLGCFPTALQVMCRLDLGDKLCPPPQKRCPQEGAFGKMLGAAPGVYRMIPVQIRGFKLTADIPGMLLRMANPPSSQGPGVTCTVAGGCVPRPNSLIMVNAISRHGQPPFSPAPLGPRSHPVVGGYVPGPWSPSLDKMIAGHSQPPSSLLCLGVPYRLMGVL